LELVQDIRKRPRAIGSGADALEKALEDRLGRVTMGRDLGISRKSRSPSPLSR
jgi:hypothetical protein